MGPRLFGVGLEDEVAANLSPNAGAQLRIVTPRALYSISLFYVLITLASSLRIACDKLFGFTSFIIAFQRGDNH